MADRAGKNDVDIQVDAINHDVSQLADTLENVLKSIGSDAKEGVAETRKQAEALLKETRARLNGNQNRVKQATHDAVESANSYLRSNPWQGIGIGATVGICLGVLLASRRQT